jgi:hypothetical protein
MNFWEDRFVGVWTTSYVKKLLYQIAMVFLVIGGLNWLCVGLMDTNAVSELVGNASSAVYILVGISALFVMFDRDTYLPFLGPMVAPCSVLQNREPPGATKEVKVIVSPNTKILYWAAEPANEKLKTISSWKDAYLNYENAGVVTANNEGVAILKVREPQAYKVPFKGRLEPHVHYRVCGESGFMERVHTVFLNQQEPEGFENYRMNLADSAASIY